MVNELISRNSEILPASRGFNMADAPAFDPEAAARRVEEVKQRLTLSEKHEIDTKKPEKSQSDKAVERIINKLGHAKRGGYFRDPEELSALVGDALSKTRQEAINGFKAEVYGYAAHASEKYAERAKNFYDETRQNVQSLQRQGLIHDDTFKVFLTPAYIDNKGRGVLMNQYNALQAEESRQQARRHGEAWSHAYPTSMRYRYRVKELVDGYALRDGDVKYQAGYSGDENTKYDSTEQITEGTFIHVNSTKPRGEKNLRCYVSPDMAKDPSAVLLAWNESINASPLKDTLYFKLHTSMANDEEYAQRSDSIVIYKSDSIDDDEFKSLLEDFRGRCDAMSPELLPSDERQLPPAASKIANGISIAGEPTYVNNYLRYTDRKAGKHSWTTFIDKMILLSISVASNRLGIVPDSIEAPGLEDETKKVFREFMLLSKINPDTMLPNEFGDKLPSWANLED